MDYFAEQIVKRSKKTKEKIAITLVVVTGIILAGIGFFLTYPLLHSFGLEDFSIVGYVLSLAVLIGIYFFISIMRIEYEYSITNGEFDFDKIIAQRKRKSILSIHCRDISSCGVYKKDEHASIKYDTKISVCPNLKSFDGVYYICFEKKDMGQSILIFKPDEKFLTTMKPFIKIKK